MLLGIALANVGLYLHGTEMGPGLRPVDGSPLDRTLDFVVTLLVNDRSRPMFALLFGFGLVTMARRLGESGTEPRRRRSVLLRRQLLLIAFGRVHAALLFEGDILGIYGATGLVLLLLMNRRPRVLVAWATVSLVLLGVLYALVALAPDSPAAPSDLPRVGGRAPGLAELVDRGAGVGPWRLPRACAHRERHRSGQHKMYRSSLHSPVVNHGWRLSGVAEEVRLDRYWGSEASC